MRLLPVLLLGLVAPGIASAAPPTTPAATVQLPSSVMNVNQEPFVVVALASSGATATERFQARRASNTYPAGEPLVVILRAEPVDISDRVTVTRAERRGNQIDLEVEEQVCLCPHTVSGTVIPYVQIELGALPRGDYVLKLREMGLTYDDELHPERAKDLRRLLELQGMPIQVR